MKLLLDECLPVDLRLALAPHEAYTVRYMRWLGIKNGRLLALAAAEGFDALVTTDGSIQHQQNLGALPVSVVILAARSNRLPDLHPLVPGLLAALRNLTPQLVPRMIHVP